MATTPYPFVASTVLTASQLNSTFNVPVGAKTASYTLVAADAGTRVQMNNASATTITVNTSLFSAGDSLFIQNIGAGTCTITAGTATVSTSGSLALAQFGGGTLYFTSASAAIFFIYSAPASAPTSRVWVHTNNGYGSSSTAIPRFTTTVVNSGADITYADSASLGSTFTINTAGMYAMTHVFVGSSGGSSSMGISVNSTQLTTDIQSITAANRLAMLRIPNISNAFAYASCASTFLLAATDVIRPHAVAGVTSGDVIPCSFTIVRVN